jgi:hypothetical protein
LSVRADVDPGTTLKTLPHVDPDCVGMMNGQTVDAPARDVSAIRAGERTQFFGNSASELGAGHTGGTQARDVATALAVFERERILASRLQLLMVTTLAGTSGRRHHPTYPTGGFGLPLVCTVSSHNLPFSRLIWAAGCSGPSVCEQTC